MDSQLIILIIQVVILVGAYALGRYIIPNMAPENIQDVAAKIALIVDYADKFVSWAKYFMKDASGVERMAEVVKQLKTIADRYKLDISEDEITAIAQKAYDQMQAGIKEAENQKAIADAAKETATIVVAAQPVEITPVTDASATDPEPEVKPILENMSDEEIVTADAVW